MTRAAVSLLAILCLAIPGLVVAFDLPVLLSAPWTPFNEDLSVNYDMIDAQVAEHVRQGVNLMWVTGGMAQWDQLRISEREKLADSYVSSCKKHGVECIVHVGAQCIYDAMGLAAYAESIGADAIAVIPPFAPEKPSSLQELVNILAMIANEAPNTPFYYYHIVGTTGLDYEMSQLLTLAKDAIPTMTGIKYVGNNLDDFQACVEMACSYAACPGGKYVMMWAPEPKAQALPYGATGFVLAEAYYAPYVKAVYDAWPNENTTWAAQDRLNELHDIIRSGSSRYVMTMLGVNVGPPRLPASPITSTLYDEVRDDLEAWGFFADQPANATTAAPTAASGSAAAASRTVLAPLDDDNDDAPRA